jgi:hypothetical protein
MNDEDYREVVEKMDASLSKRTSREETIEQALSCSMPGLLRRILDKHGGRVRPALDDLNERLDEAGVETNVSPNTFYKYLNKYRHR